MQWHQLRIDDATINNAGINHLQHRTLESINEIVSLRLIKGGPGCLIKALKQGLSYVRCGPGQLDPVQDVLESFGAPDGCGLVGTNCIQQSQFIVATVQFCTLEQPVKQFRTGADEFEPLQRSQVRQHGLWGTRGGQRTNR